MSCVVGRARPRFTLRMVAVAALAVGAAGCSSDTTRFASNPFSNPYATQPSGEVTGSVQSQPLPQPTTGHLPPPPKPWQPKTVAAQPSGPTYTGSTPAPTKSWNRPNSTVVTVNPGDTLYGIARRYGVPVASLMRANNLNGASRLRIGQRLVIPGRGNTAAQTNSQPTYTGTASARPVSGAVHMVAPGETLTQLSRRYRVSVSAIAAANNIPPYAQLKIGDRITIPGAQAAVPSTPPPMAAAPAPPRHVAMTEPTARAQVVTPTEQTPEQPSAVDAAKPLGQLAFRWPVRGRIISAFGPKTSGERNDGINLSVPVGTPVKASEDGVVAYAGNELKLYGNLVLIRHADGYVTAYANTSEIMVKKGDTVRRGQTIAKSGQTGSVSAPQLHFEIRKGAQPVDPMKYLDGA